MEDLTLDISDVITRFPEFRVAILRLTGEGIPRERPAVVDEFIKAAEAHCRETSGGLELSAIAGIAAWRRAYKGFGIKSTSYRSSVERLVKRVLAGDSLPRVNAFVDLYNAVSLKHVLCLGADDTDKLPDHRLAFRFARAGDHFIDMAPLEGLAAEQSPKVGEVVYASGSHVLCRRWNWRQDARTTVEAHTRHTVLTMQSHGSGDVEQAAQELMGIAKEALHLDSTIRIADADTVQVSL